MSRTPPGGKVEFVNAAQRPYLNSKQARKHLGDMSERQFRRAYLEQGLRSTTVGARRLFRLDWIEEWMANQQRERKAS